jgi:uncharacterized protein (DUF433 family)
MATLIPETVSVPLREDEHGSLRIGETRVLLEIVIHEFRNGATPEEIVASYDALELADVYLVLGFYLRQTDKIDAYLRRREQEAQVIRARIEASQRPRPNLQGLLMVRAKAREAANGTAD